MVSVRISVALLQDTLLFLPDKKLKDKEEHMFLEVNKDLI